MTPEDIASYANGPLIEWLGAKCIEMKIKKDELDPRLADLMQRFNDGDHTIALDLKKAQIEKCLMNGYIDAVTDVLAFVQRDNEQKRIGLTIRDHFEDGVITRGHVPECDCETCMNTIHRIIIEEELDDGDDT